MTDKIVFNESAMDSSVVIGGLTDDDIAYRHRFIAEYFVDYSPFNAAIRCGTDQAFADETAKALMKEAYTLRLISERQNLRNEMLSEEEEAERDKNLIKNTLRNVMHNGSATTKVMAAETLAKLNGLLDKKTEEEIIEVKASNVMVVPMATSDDDWEAIAVQQQKALTDTVINDEIHK